MRNRIWTEVTQAKHNVEFVSLYIERQRLLLRLFNMFVLVFSSAGIMGWKIWDKLPLVACVIIAAVSIIRLLQPHIIMSDKQLRDLDEIQRFYSQYFNKLEKLWYDYESERMNEEKATNSFFKIKETETRLNPIIAQTIKSKPKKIVKKAKIYSDIYFNQIFNN